MRDPRCDDDETMAYCTCCERRVPVGQWDWLYWNCADCAFEASLEHFPCDHGAARAAERHSEED